MERLSVIVVCYNEEQRIATCLASVSWADEIILVDSFSTDRTIEIAHHYTDKIYQYPWQGYGKQKNIALSHASHDWILGLDADEVVSQELAIEIQRILKEKPGYAGYRMPRLSFYMGRFLKHCWYPDYKVRLFSKQRARWDGREVHEEILIAGPIGTLRGNLLHYSFPSLEDHIQTLQAYTTLSSELLWKDKKRFPLFKLLGSPLAMFFKLYFLKRGFLDGMPGLVASVLSAFHEFVKYAKYYELRKGLIGLKAKGDL